jgi:hypothetical protein
MPTNHGWQVHASQLDELQNMANVMLSKIVMLESTMQKQKPTKIGGLNLSQGSPPTSKRSKNVVSEQKFVAKSPFSRSKSLSDHNVDNVILLPDDDDIDKKESKTTSNIQSTYLKGSTSKVPTIFKNQFITSMLKWLYW